MPETSYINEKSPVAVLDMAHASDHDEHQSPETGTEEALSKIDVAEISSSSELPMTTVMKQWS